VGTSCGIVALLTFVRSALCRCAKNTSLHLPPAALRCFCLIRLNFPKKRSPYPDGDFFRFFPFMVLFFWSAASFLLRPSFEGALKQFVHENF